MKLNKAMLHFILMIFQQKSFARESIWLLPLMNCPDYVCIQNNPSNTRMKEFRSFNRRMFFLDGL